MVKKYFHRIIDEVYEFDGTNQEEISVATNNRILPTTSQNVMALPIENKVILIEVGQYVVLSPDGVRIITKEQLESIYTPMPDEVEEVKDSVDNKSTKSKK